MSNVTFKVIKKGIKELAAAELCVVKQPSWFEWLKSWVLSYFHIQIIFHFRFLQQTLSILLNLEMWFQLLGKNKNIVNMIRLSFYCPESRISNIWLTGVSLLLYFSCVEHWLNIFYNVHIVIFRFEKMENGCRKDLDALKNAFKHNDPVPKFHYENKTFSLVQ